MSDCHCWSICPFVCFGCPSVCPSLLLSVSCLSVGQLVHQSFHTAVCLSIPPSICLSVHQSVRLSAHPFFCRSVHSYLGLSIHWSVCLLVHPSIHPSIYLSISLWVGLSINLPVCRSVRQSVYQSVYLGLCLSVQWSIKNKNLVTEGGEFIHILTFWGRLIQGFLLTRVKIKILLYKYSIFKHILNSFKYFVWLYWSFCTFYLRF